MTFINISPSAVVQPPIQKLSPPPVYHWSSILHLTFSLPHTSVRRWSFHHSCFELLNFWAIFPTTSLIWCMFYPKAQISSDNIKLNYPWWHNSYHITRICMGLGGQSPSGLIFFSYEDVCKINLIVTEDKRFILRAHAFGYFFANGSFTGSYYFEP